MKESFENQWKQQMYDPEVLQDFIPKDARNRIEKKLFPSRGILWWKTALSHAAALLLGIVTTWLIVTGSNEKIHTTGENIISQDTRPHEARVTDIAPVKTGAAPEGTVIKNARKPTSKEISTPTDASHAHRSSTREEEAIVNNHPDEEDAPTIHHHKPEEAPVPQDPEQHIAAELPKKRTAIPVSDMAPVSSSMTFTERISQPVNPQTASKTQSSPFKIFNR